MPSKPSTQKPNGSQHLAPTTDTKAPTADTNEQTERIDYYKAVAEIRELFTQVDEAERGYYRIGQLVYEVMQDAKYGDRTLTTLAKAIYRVFRYRQQSRYLYISATPSLDRVYGEPT